MTIPKAPTSGNLWVEPESAASVENPPIYPYNHITQTESGHSFELDDTPGRERIRIQHRSKTFIEMHPNGDEVHKIIGDGYEIITGGKNVLIKGVCNITINGDCNMNVKGDLNQKIDGDYILGVKGKIDIRSVKDLTIAGDADIVVSANENFGGSLSLSAAESINVGSDLYIDGSITCDTLNAESRVSAGMGVSAGPFGFTSALGGLSLGFPPLEPIAIPGCVTALGHIESMVAVLAPDVTCMMMSAELMGDTVNSMIYDTHFHICALGPTSPPIMPFMPSIPFIV